MYRLGQVRCTVNEEIPAVKTGFMTANSSFFTVEYKQEIIYANINAA